MSEIRKEVFVALIHGNSPADVPQMAVLFRRYVLFLIWRDLCREVVRQSGSGLAQLRVQAKAAVTFGVIVARF